MVGQHTKTDHNFRSGELIKILTDDLQQRITHSNSLLIINLMPRYIIEMMVNGGGRLNLSNRSAIKAYLWNFQIWLASLSTLAIVRLEKKQS